MKKSSNTLATFTFFLLCFPFLSIIAQEEDLCKIIGMEQIHAKHRFQHKSAARTAEYDVNYYRIELDIIPSSRFISGNVTSYFTTKTSNLGSVVFDFGNMLFADSVQYHGVTYTNQSTAGNNTIEVFFPTSLSINTLDSVTIFYKGTPRGGPSSPPFASVPVSGGNLVWTLSEPYGSQEWWPCKNDLTDKADSVEIIISTTPGNRVASNGLLLSIDTTGGNNIYHWKTTYPIVSYLVAIAVGKYDFYESKYALNNDSLLLQHFVFQNETFNQSDKEIMPFMVFFDSLLGEYPFIKEKYGHASFSFPGGMEHQTISFMGGYGGELKAHELAHQWFGNKVTCGSWSDLWLNESFATYLTGITYEFDVVHDPAFWITWLDFSELSGFNYPHGSVYREGNDTLNVSSLFNNQVYAKGAMSLHTLRYKIGDSAFFTATRNFINDPNFVYSFAKTTDLKAHMEASSGMNLTEFFNDWIYGKGYPVIDTYWNQSGNTLTLDVRQTTTDTSVSFFDTKLPYRLIGNNIDTVIVIDLSTNVQQFNIPMNQVINSVEFDAYNEIFAQEGLTTSLSKQRDLERKIKLYPNPSSDRIQLQLPQELKLLSIEVFNIQGQRVNLSMKNEELDVSELSAGLYLIVIESTEGTLKKKFQKID